MAGSARYTALLDSNVLYPAPIRDLLMSLACAGLYHARWTSKIHEEWTRNLLANRSDLGDKLPRIVALMNGAVPDCLVENYDWLIDAIDLPDANDRHVLAAAIVGHADAIVTFNSKHFPDEIASRYCIEVQHPDDFVMNQLELREIDAITAIKALRARLRNPARSAEQLIGTYEHCGLPLTASQLRTAIELL